MWPPFEFLKYDVSMSQDRHYTSTMSSKIVLILPNSADPHEMPPYAAFHLGLHCLQFESVNRKGLI